MTYSKIHEKFSEYLNVPDALTNPEKYLGPNWQDVLNFWIYLDTLSKQDKKKIYDLYYALDYNVRWSAADAANNAADEFVGGEIRPNAWRAVVDVTGWAVFGFATLELIAHHKLIEQNKTLLALQYCTKS